MGVIVLVETDGVQKIDQLDNISQIMNLVAQDYTVDSLKRFVRLYKETNNCQRVKSESIASYLELFAGSAMLYLNSTDAENSTESQNFAIVLVLDAVLMDQTFSNIISNLFDSLILKDVRRAVTTLLQTDLIRKVRRFFYAH